ncbi:MAG: hypothetical protein C0593_04545 [Marinilabiliales bacterium]|nr:MAG: hypothetical protein C0593_04545 [Marinilabiliales bacterium]
MKIPEQYKFIIQLGKALHTYGVPSYKSQIYLSEIAEKKGIKGSFMDTPTWINYVFYEEDEHTYNYVECVPPGELNLGGLSRIVEITNNVLSGKSDFSEAKTNIENLRNSKMGYGWLVELLAYMISAGAFCIILDTSWASAFLAFFLGAVVYGLTLLSRKSVYLRSTLESMVAFISTIITGFMAMHFEQINMSMTILASIIVFIPGLSLTTALEEITSRSLVSGTAKLFDALVSLFKQFFGVVLALAVFSIFVELKPNEVVNDVPAWFDYIAILMLTYGLAPVFKVRLKDVPFCVLSGFASYYTALLLGDAGILLSVFIGTVVAVTFSRVLSIITKTPRLVFLVPGIIMLVPGSKAFIGLSSILLDSGPAHNNMGEQILYIFMGIIGGLLFSGRFMDKKEPAPLKLEGK